MCLSAGFEHPSFVRTGASNCVLLPGTSWHLPANERDSVQMPACGVVAIVSFSATGSGWLVRNLGAERTPLDLDLMVKARVGTAFAPARKDSIF
jgi:hypothetical protein